MNNARNIAFWVVLLLLILFPLSIPTSWTTDYLAIKRGTATEAATP